MNFSRILSRWPFVLFGGCVAYFVIGIFMWMQGAFAWQSYMEIGGIVGALASVAGLVSLIRRPLSASDILAYEADVMRRFADATEDYQKIERSRAETKQEIEGLKKQQQAMQVLMQKAALTVYLRERRLHSEERILETIGRNTELRRLLDELPQLEARLTQLEEEFAQNPDVKRIQEIIRKAETPTFSKFLGSSLKVAIRRWD